MRKILVTCLALGVAAPTGASGAEEAPPISVLRIPVSVSFDQVRAALERTVPGRVDGAKDDPLPSPVRDDRLEWTFQRTPLAVEGSGDTLTVRTNIGGTARVHGKIKVAFGAGPHFSAHADLAAAASLSTSPVVRPNWTVDPRLRGSADLQEARIPILKVTHLSVRGHLQPHLDAQLAAQIARLDAQLAADRGLRTAVEKAWTDLCRAHRLPGKDGAPDLHLMVEPVAAGVGPFAVGPDRLTVTIGLSARTWIADTPRTPTCIPLPDATPPGPGGTTLEVAADLGYATLSTQLREQFDRRIAKGGLEATIRSVDLAAEGDRLAATVDATVGPAGLPALASHQRLRLLATPTLDVAAEKLRLTDISVTGASGSEGGAAAIAALVSLLAGDVAEIDLAGPAAEARGKLATAAERLRGGGVPGVRISSVRIDDVRLTGLAVGPAALRVRAAASGDVAVEALPFDLLTR